MTYQELRNMYCHYLMKSQVNSTCTDMSDHTFLSHDIINRFLSSHFTEERSFYEKVYLDLPILRTGGYLIFDDTVLDKRYSHKIEMVRKQYSGNVGGIVEGIGVVVMLYYVPDEDMFYLLGYRIFDPQLDQKTKIDHVFDLLAEADENCIGYFGVLMDSWYAVSSLFQRIAQTGKYFYCPIKKNRLVKEANRSIYFTVEELAWNQQERDNGKSLKVKGLGLEVRLFLVTVSTNRIDYVLTNDLSSMLSTKEVTKKQKMRWNIECFNREIKQVTSIAKCQCRKAPAQRTHIFCAMLVWHKLKQIAYQTYDTIYQVKIKPFRKFLIEQLKGECPIFA